jgi:hypothetical protein
MRSIFLVLCLFSASLAHANFLIEPYAGGQFGGEYTESGKIDSSNFASSIFGGRVGFDFSQLLVGGEYMANQNVNVHVDGPNTWGASSTLMSMSSTAYGAFLGYEFMSPLTMRVIGTFFTNTDAHLQHSTASGATDYDQDQMGYGYKGELGARLARYLTMGVSYYYFVFTKANDNLKGTNSSNVPVNSMHGVMATLTIPLEF